MHRQPNPHEVPIPTGAIIVAVEALREAAGALGEMDPSYPPAVRLCVALRGISAGLETLAAWAGEQGDPLAEIYEVFELFREPEEELTEEEPPPEEGDGE